MYTSAAFPFSGEAPEKHTVQSKQSARVCASQPAIRCDPEAHWEGCMRVCVCVHLICLEISVFDFQPVLYILIWIILNLRTSELGVRGGRGNRRAVERD